jgi:putative oxidoreductase
MQRAIQRVFATRGGWYLAPFALTRFAIGAFFFASGFNKMFMAANRAQMLQTITDAGIPFPHVMAVLVTACELFGGLALAFGLLARPAALVLLSISTVALLTVGIHQIPQGLDVISWYSWLLYLPEAGYILICLMICVQGGGPASIDLAIHRRLAASA